MALLVECPKCRKRYSLRKNMCDCGFALKKASGKIYWIEYYFEGRRRRERIGPSKAAAEQRERDVLKARAEERYIDKDPAVRLSLFQVCDWYLALPEVKAKKSFGRDEEMIKHLKRLLGGETKIKDITAGKVESYQRQRLAELSPRRVNETVKPATINKEVTCLKTIFNRAVRHGKLDNNPISQIRKLAENNVRMRVLAHEEIESLIKACPYHLRPVVEMAYYTGMRRSEIVFLTWDEVDLDKGFIRLSASRTKTNAARNIPLHPRLKEILRQLPRGLRTNRVFLLKGKPFAEIKRSFNKACRDASLNNFTFHDLRHCALNNLRLAGNDYFRIMAISGHKTMSVFKRYNLVTEEELSQVTWLNDPAEKKDSDDVAH